MAKGLGPELPKKYFKIYNMTKTRQIPATTHMMELLLVVPTEPSGPALRFRVRFSRSEVTSANQLAFASVHDQSRSSLLLSEEESKW